LDSSTVNIIISEGTLGDLYDKLGNIERSLIYDPGTNQIVGTWADLTGSVTNTCLVVTQQNFGNMETVCNTCSTSASGTLLCNVNATQGTLRAYLKNNINPSSSISLLVELEDQLPGLLGETGPLVTFLLLVTVAIVGAVMFSIPVGVIIFSLGTMITKQIGFHSLGWDIIIGIVIIGGIIAWATRDKK